METYKEIAGWISSNKSTILLASLLLLLMLFPYFQSTATSELILILIFTAIILSGIYAVSYDLRYVAAGLLLAVPAFVMGWTNLFVPSPNAAFSEMVFLIIFLAYTIIVLLKHILADAEVTIDELYSAVSVYIMIGIAFGLLYRLIEMVNPGSFFPDTGTSDMSSLIYYSFATLSSLGFGDLNSVPVFARPIVLIESIVGVVYVAVLIGALVSAAGSLKKPKKKALAHEEAAHHTIFQDRPWLLVLAAVMLNFATSVMMITLKVPVYLDTWATSFSVIIGGLGIGVIAGVLYNTLLAATYRGTDSLIWILSSILVASTTYYFHKKEWIDIRTPARLITVGLVTGLLNAILTLIIIHPLNLPPYQGAVGIGSIVLQATGDPLIASISEQATAEMIDKTAAIILAALALFFIERLLEKADESRKPE